ncbi:MAG: response regulator transcription factor [Spirochaetales bacterium]|nr:response regulator transcription factor [Spirochaetales bacterium]
MKILIIEDNIRISDNISYILKSENYNFEASYDGEEGYQLARTGNYDLIILDLMLPGMDGFEILEALRANKVNTPVLVLSAKSQVEDKVKALNLGSDDYITKPFAASELLARVRSITRRNHDLASNIITIGCLTVDTNKKEAFVEVNRLELTQKEYELLEFFSFNKNKVVSKVAIAQYIWGESLDYFTMSNFIDVHISNLRKKIENACKKKYIKTKRGFGFILSEEEEE